MGEQTDNILGKNIRYFRMFYGETQKGLAKIIHVTKSSVCAYERGNTIPVSETLSDIATHYGITVDEICNTDFSQNDMVKLDTDFLDRMLEAEDLIFPLFNVDDFSNVVNEHKKRGYSLIKRIKRGQLCTEELLLKITDNAIEELYKAVNEDDEDYELMANLMGMLFARWSTLFDKDWQKQFLYKYSAGTIKPTDCLEIERSISKPIQRIRRRFIHCFEKRMTYVIRRLKSNSDWNDLGDYYLALRHQMNLIDNGLSIEMNKAIGRQMMLSFAEVGNKYALRMLQLVS